MLAKGTPLTKTTSNFFKVNTWWKFLKLEGDFEKLFQQVRVCPLFFFPSSSRSLFRDAQLLSIGDDSMLCLQDKGKGLVASVNPLEILKNETIRM